VRTIGVVTVARSDYGIYLPVLRKIQADPDLRLYLIVSGMHLSPEFGLTVRAIEADGFQIGERVEMLLSSDSPEGIAKSIGLGVIGFAQAYGRFRPDILVVLGDRFEMYAAVLAALPFKLPVAHIHGGEITQGAIDDALRHSMTKLSHLHFVSTQEYARRVEQLGEEPWRVTVAGAPSLDNIQAIHLLSVEELETRYGLRLQSPPLLVTFHPVTLEFEQAEWQACELLAALDSAGMPVVFTLPNADTGGRLIMHRIEEFVQAHPLAQKADNLGTQGYFSLMAVAVAMVGNSSSGIIEAPSFGLPVVNIGTRQTGRVRGANVIDVGYTRAEILSGIRAAAQSEFRERLRQIENPYGQGQASQRIVDRLKSVPLDDRLILKRFLDLTGFEHSALPGMG
jgi:UDP-hydrolysing UDP-N-acetyl-D-glucosamine 2-epimerase